MQALSRNTASVAQDFHNAGGGEEDQPRQMSLLEAITSKLQSYRKGTSNGETYGLKATSPSQCSPPASSPNHQICTQRPEKRRRRPQLKSPPPPSSDHDQAKLGGSAIFDNLYHKSINTYLHQLQTSEYDDVFKAKLVEFLENNPDISISNIDLSQNLLSSAEKRSHRKQMQPRKIEKVDTFSVAALRDKHMERLVAQRLFCRLCKNRDLFGSYHTIVSLTLHKYWRHSRKRFRCNTCGNHFSRKYKLNLHQILKHKNPSSHRRKY